MKRPITSIFNGKPNTRLSSTNSGYANCARPFMIQRNHPKFITKCPNIGGDMADRANLTKIEFGTLSIKAEGRASVTWYLETDSRIDELTNGLTDGQTDR